MRYVVAVSGGIDSVVLLHLLVLIGGHELIVAHFDHGTRDDSADDARFSEGLAKMYGLPFTTAREELGESASEERARERRYHFLRSEAKKRDSLIVTAHHLDDLIETVAINLSRGTGWRGLSAMDAPDIVRPLLPYSKQDIRQYALKERLEWVEDSTNVSEKYLRNRLRMRINRQLSSEDKTDLLDLWRRQRKLKAEIAKEVEGSLAKADGNYSRYLFTMAGEKPALELLHAAVLHEAGRTLTRPQLERALLAIKTAAPYTKYTAGNSVELGFKTRTFTVNTS